MKTKSSSFDAKKKFESIYDQNEWGAGSGEGSLPENTLEYREFLAKFLKDYEIDSVLDLGCGDWQIASLVSWDGVDYTGIDVVQGLVDRNTKEFGSKNVKFIQGDIANCYLPSADVIIIKDVLQHWPTKVVKKFLPKLRNFKYALIINDNYPDETLNGDPKEDYGHFRPVALLEKPFSLKNAEKIFDWRTDPKMPKGFKNKEVLLVTNPDWKVKLSRASYRQK